MHQLREESHDAVRQIKAEFGSVLAERDHHRVEIAFIHARFRSRAHLRGSYSRHEVSPDCGLWVPDSAR
ncbi:hypothetical protein AGR1A_Lc80288 [Agrobacterium fabacearum CFBP 5771]|nr:hypothetical protein AGR1A_Lc80288 [Agrobacterium fabacearum CFBP 5771]